MPGSVGVDGKNGPPGIPGGIEKKFKPKNKSFAFVRIRSDEDLYLLVSYYEIIVLV